VYKKKNCATKYRSYKKAHKNHCCVNDSSLQIEMCDDSDALDTFSTIYNYYIEKVQKESPSINRKNQKVADSKEKLLSMVEMRKKIMTAYDDAYKE